MNTALAVLARDGRSARPRRRPAASAATPAAFTERNQEQVEREYA
jgi:hypothetical protein